MSSSLQSPPKKKKDKESSLPPLLGLPWLPPAQEQESILDFGLIGPELEAAAAAESSTANAGAKSDLSEL
jgi:hypothetical protein